DDAVGAPVEPAPQRLEHADGGLPRIAALRDETAEGQSLGGGQDADVHDVNEGGDRVRPRADDGAPEEGEQDDGGKQDVVARMVQVNGLGGGATRLGGHRVVVRLAVPADVAMDDARVEVVGQRAVALRRG